MSEGEICARHFATGQPVRLKCRGGFITEATAAETEAPPADSQAAAEPEAAEISAAVADAEEEGMPAVESLAPESEAVETEESGTIENAGFPGHNQSETDATDEHTGE